MTQLTDNELSMVSGGTDTTNWSQVYNYIYNHLNQLPKNLRDEFLAGNPNDYYSLRSWIYSNLYDYQVLEDALEVG